MRVIYHQLAGEPEDIKGSLSPCPHVPPPSRSGQQTLVTELTRSTGSAKPGPDRWEVVNHLLTALLVRRRGLSKQTGENLPNNGETALSKFFEIMPSV